jgi:hypothetical protein
MDTILENAISLAIVLLPAGVTFTEISEEK